MKKQIFRTHLITRIKNVVNTAVDAGLLNHSGTKGRLREIMISDLVRPLLPNGVEVATGTVIDSQGNQSLQMDVIIYSTAILPPFMQLTEQAIIPVEACIQAIEIKSRLTAQEMDDSIKKAVSIKNLAIKMPEPTEIDKIYNIKRHHVKVSPIFSVFAFSSDLARKDEGLRYGERLPKQYANHILINDICVLKKGYWLRNGASPTDWAQQKATENFDEVIEFLALAANAIPLWIQLRGKPSFSHYLRDH